MTINCNGKLLDLSIPQVMGILNVTPDSFYANSRMQTESDIANRTQQIIHEGAKIIDVGAYSSRPGASDIDVAEECSRLRFGLKIVRQLAPNAIISVDTFRSDVARMCVEEFGVDIINDISAGELDSRMFKTVADLNVPYIIMHMKGTPRTMQQYHCYADITQEVFQYFCSKINLLHSMGVADIILDPGFGFSKTLSHNYQLMGHLEELGQLDLPLLVGISRKSMIYKLVGSAPEEALNGTSILNTIALMKGANILRVHDVKACVEAVKIYVKMTEELSRDM